MNAQKGSALLIVLMILALMAALAAEMTISFQVQLQRTRRINDSLQGKYALLYAEAQSMARFQEKPRDVLTHSESRRRHRRQLADKRSAPLLQPERTEEYAGRTTGDATV